MSDKERWLSVDLRLSLSLSEMSKVLQCLELCKQ